MNGEFPENDALWRLLGRSTAVEPSPFFARNVARAIRNSSPAPLFSLPRWISAAAFAPLAAAFAISLLQSPATPGDDAYAEIFDRAAGLDKIAFVEDPTPLLFVEP